MSYIEGPPVLTPQKKVGQNPDELIRMLEQVRERNKPILLQANQYVEGHVDVEVTPDDSVSRVGSQVSRTSSTSSIKSMRAKAIKKQIELEAQSAILQQCQEMEQRRRELQRQQQDLEYQELKLKVETELDAAKAITEMLKDEVCNAPRSYRYEDRSSLASKTSAANSVMSSVAGRRCEPGVCGNENVHDIVTDCHPYGDATHEEKDSCDFTTRQRSCKSSA